MLGNQSENEHGNGLPEAEELERRLLTIFEVATILVTEHDLDTMLARLMQSLVETLEAADVGSLWLYDPPSGRLISRSSIGYDLPTLQKMQLAPGEGLAGRVFQTGQATWYATAEAVAGGMIELSPENRELFSLATAGVAQPVSSITVPLSTAKERIGVLSLLTLHPPARFSEADLVFLQRVANLITLAIENVSLREELKAAEALSEANRLKSELISTLAHEMRTPLTSIKGYSTAMLMDEISFSQEAQREFLQIIDDETDVLQNLIHDLLESSIIDAGLLHIELQPTRLPPLAESVAHDTARRSPKHRIVTDFAPGFPIVDADPDRITQVLRNLLDNAVKYSPDGGLIVVRGDTRPGEVIVSVADQGIGLAPEHLNRLFEKYWRAKSGIGRHVVGSGLGLPISHTIIESHGGRIWAESQLGQGSTFYFTLPCADAGQNRG